MRKFTKLALLAVVAGLFMPAANALADSHEGKFKVHGEVRARVEYSENITDLQDHDSNTPFLNDAVSFWPYRVRLGVTGEFSRNVVGHVEIQNVGVFGGDVFTPFRAADDPLLQGFRNDFINSETTLYQGFIDLKNLGENLSIRVGRAEHTVGNELLIGDLDFYGGITFDGARLMFDFENWDLDVFYYNVGEGNVSLTGLVAGGLPNGGDEDVQFMGATANFELSDNGQMLTPYLLYKRDGIGANGINFSFDQHSFYTIGALYERPINSRDEIEDGRHWDWSAEAATQIGTYDPNGNQNAIVFCNGDNGNGDCDISSTIFEGWIGYNWELGDTARQRVHLGVFQTSGEDSGDPNDFNDGDIEFFIPMFGDIHDMNRLGNADLFGVLGASSAAGSFPGGFTNLTNINLGYNIYGEKHDFMVAFHQFTTTEEQTLGGGVTEDDLGTEFDVEYGYHYSPNVDFLAGVALFQSGDLLDAFVGPNGADDIMRAYGQVRLRF